MSKPLKINGFHGTSREFVQSIIREGFRKSSEKEWFGAGIYFFETFGKITDGFTEARDWAKNVKKFDKWSVFVSNIETSSYVDLVEDLDHKLLYDRIKEALFNAHLRAGKSAEVFTETVIFLEMASSMDIDLIRCLVDSTRPTGYYSFVVRRPQVQICVKKTECILRNMLFKEGI